MWTTDSNEESAPPQQLITGSREGMNTSITKIQGLGTTSAHIETLYTRENAKEYCVGYELDNSEECILKELATTTLVGHVEANCETGIFTNLNNTTYKFSGVREYSDQRTSEPYIIQRYNNGALGDVLDGSSASGYWVALQTFATLCPNRGIDTSL